MIDRLSAGAPRPITITIIIILAFTILTWFIKNSILIDNNDPGKERRLVALEDLRLCHLPVERMLWATGVETVLTSTEGGTEPIIAKTNAIPLETSIFGAVA